MKTRCCRGQNIIEFIILLGLVATCSIAGWSLMGDQVVSMLSSSNESVDNYQPFGVDVNREVAYTGKDSATDPVADPGAEPSVDLGSPQNTLDVNGIEVTYYDSNAASFSVNGQDVVLSSDMVALQNTMMQTSGSSGLTDLVKEIQYMIETHELEYPPGNVPVEVTYGSGNRMCTDPTWSDYLGTAAVNMTQVTVGDHVVILNHDQTCDNTTGGPSMCNYMGDYRIEGNISGSSFTGDVTSKNTPYSDVRGDYTATVDSSGGLQLKDSLFTQTYGLGTETATYNWNIDFTSNNNQFSI